ncbi:putative periplasmic lipoprotein [Corallococcus sp. M7]
MRGVLGVGALGLMLMAGCAAETKLRPVPEAGILQGGKSSAITEEAGVRLTADGSAWQGSPSDLERRVTPVYVRLENHGDRPLRLQYKDFALVGQESRFRYSALAPLSLRRASSSRDTEEPASIRPAMYPAGRVWVGGGYGYGYGPWRGWGPGWYGGPWGWGSPFYGPYPYYYEQPLPTEDMLNDALPEGTLEPGGTQEGFLYFQGVAHRENAVTLQLNLVDAQTGEPFGSMGIPFEVSTK